MGTVSLRELYRTFVSMWPFSHLYWVTTSALWTADKLDEWAMKGQATHAQNCSCGKKKKNGTSGGANGS